MELHEAIMTRRSYRAFKDDPVPQECIDKIAEAGLWAPSGLGRQSSIILQIAGKETRDLLEAANAHAAGNDEWKPFYGAPTVLVVLASKESPTYVYDGSCTIENMLLEATDLGLGSIWVHRAKEVFETDLGKELLTKAGVEGDYEGIGNVVVGYPVEPNAVGAERKPGRVFRIE